MPNKELDVRLPMSVVKEIVLDYLYELSPTQLDTLFAEQMNEYHDADKLFKKVKFAIENPMRVS